MDARASTDFSISSLILMEHAARGIASIAAQAGSRGGQIFVLCGPGNNGGDGYGAARFLLSCGRRVQTWRCAPAAPTEGDAGYQFDLLSRASGVDEAYSAPERLLEALPRASVIVDALFGVGLTRALQPPYSDWIEAMNASAGVRVAVDVPSGLDADTGAALPLCVRADITATMAAPKHGLVANPAAAGQIIEVDIGLPGAVHRPYLRA